jgi:myo-inositol-1(or 4)-monophosphatase
MAAGLLIVREAGGFAEAIGAGEDPFASGTVLSANAEIFDSFARVIRNV